MTKPMHARCGAHCRTTGLPCKNWGMPNGRCRMHGGKSPTKTGHRTTRAKAIRAESNAIKRAIRSLLGKLAG